MKTIFFEQSKIIHSQKINTLDISFQQELRDAYASEAVSTGQERMLVTMAIPGGEWTINDGYEIEPLGRYVIHSFSYKILLSAYEMMLIKKCIFPFSRFLLPFDIDT